MNELLLRLVSHMRWADTLVADALDTGDPLPEAARLFAHVASVEHLWHCRITNETPRLSVWPSLPVGDARELARVEADWFERIVRESGESDLARVVAYRNSAGRDFRGAVSDIILHAAMHGEHHRGQVARLLREAGREPPYTDYVQFARRDQ